VLFILKLLLSSQIISKLNYLKSQGPSIYTKNRIFSWLIVVVNFFRDVVLMIIEIVLNAIVIILLKQYMDRKLRLSTQTQESDKGIKKDKTMRNNIIIAVIRGFLSVILHIITFMVIFMLF